MANKRQNLRQRQRQCRFKYATITESQMLFIEHSLGQELLLGKKTPLFFQSEQLKSKYYQFNKEWLLWTATSSLSFLISVPSSSQCLVYCHLAVFSLSTTWLIIVIIIIIIIIIMIIMIAIIIIAIVIIIIIIVIIIIIIRRRRRRRRRKED